MYSRNPRGVKGTPPQGPVRVQGLSSGTCLRCAMKDWGFGFFGHQVFGCQSIFCSAPGQRRIAKNCAICWNSLKNRIRLRERGREIIEERPPTASKRLALLLRDNYPQGEERIRIRIPLRTSLGSIFPNHSRIGAVRSSLLGQDYWPISRKPLKGILRDSPAEGTLSGVLTFRKGGGPWSLDQGHTHKGSLPGGKPEINKHRPPHRYPTGDKAWGEYLSGLIDGDGWLNRPGEQPNLTICFHEKDVSLAYKIKSLIGYGTISKIKNKKAHKYVLTNSKAFKRWLPHLNNLRTKRKLERYLALCKHYGITPKLSRRELKNSFWLAGFIDADGHLKLYIRKKNFEVRLKLVIDLKIEDFALVSTIKKEFGGYLYERKNPSGSVSYDSVNFKNYLGLIAYLDNFHLNSNKYKEYVIWRRAYFYRRDPVKINRMKERLSRLRF